MTEAGSCLHQESYQIRLIQFKISSKETVNPSIRPSVRPFIYPSNMLRRTSTYLQSLATGKLLKAKRCYLRTVDLFVWLYVLFAAFLVNPSLVDLEASTDGVRFTLLYISTGVDRRQDSGSLTGRCWVWSTLTRGKRRGWSHGHWSDEGDFPHISARVLLRLITLASCWSLFAPTTTPREDRNEEQKRTKQMVVDV